VWAEALDGGDWKAKVPARDKLMMQRAPFDKPPTEIMRVEQRYQGISEGQAALALVSEDDENRHWTRTYALTSTTPSKPWSSSICRRTNITKTWLADFTDLCQRALGSPAKRRFDLPQRRGRLARRRRPFLESARLEVTRDRATLSLRRDLVRVVPLVRRRRREELSDVASNRRRLRPTRSRTLRELRRAW